MTDIPEDIVKQARRVYDALGRGSVSDSERIARAILAERQRCAKIAAEALLDLAANTAAAIRSPEPKQEAML